MNCPKCHSAMKHVLRFTKERNCELYVCKNCYFETKPKRLVYNSLEIMQDNNGHNTKECDYKLNVKQKEPSKKKCKKKRKKKNVQNRNKTSR